MQIGITGLKVSKSQKQLMVSSILPKNERKQFDLRYHTGYLIAK